MTISLNSAQQHVPKDHEIFLDHIGFFASNLSSAADAFARLGFLLSPVNVHYNLGANGIPIVTGTSNRLATLRNGYLEIVGATGDTSAAAQLRSAILRYEGLHLLAFARADIRAEQQRLMQVGFSHQEIICIRRRVETPEGEKEFSCEVLRGSTEEMPEGRVQMLSHHTPELVWIESRMIHKNTAEALTSVLMCVEDPERTAARYATYTARGFVKVKDCWVIALDCGSILITSAERAKRMLPSLILPGLPFIAGVAICTADLSRTKHCLKAGHISPERSTHEFVCVGPGDGIGAYMLFHSPTACDPWLMV